MPQYLCAMVEVYSDQYGPGITYTATPYRVEVMFDSGKRVTGRLDGAAPLGYVWVVNGQRSVLRLSATNLRPQPPVSYREIVRQIRGDTAPCQCLFCTHAAPVHRWHRRCNELQLVLEFRAEIRF